MTDEKDKNIHPGDSQSTTPPAENLIPEELLEAVPEEERGRIPLPVDLASAIPERKKRIKSFHC